MENKSEHVCDNDINFAYPIEHRPLPKATRTLPVLTGTWLDVFGGLDIVQQDEEVLTVLPASSIGPLTLVIGEGNTGKSMFSTFLANCFSKAVDLLPIVHYITDGNDAVKPNGDLIQYSNNTRSLRRAVESSNSIPVECVIEGQHVTYAMPSELIVVDDISACGPVEAMRSLNWSGDNTAHMRAGIEKKRLLKPSSACARACIVNVTISQLPDCALGTTLTGLRTRGLPEQINFFADKVFHMETCERSSYGTECKITLVRNKHGASGTIGWFFMPPGFDGALTATMFNFARVSHLEFGVPHVSLRSGLKQWDELTPEDEEELYLRACTITYNRDVPNDAIRVHVEKLVEDYQSGKFAEVLSKTSYDAQGYLIDQECHFIEVLCLHLGIDKKELGNLLLSQQ